MEGIFDLSTKTGEIVTRLPETSTILKQYKIDFCCGGNRPIGEVITEKNLNGDEVLEKLNELYAKSIEKTTISFEALSSTELINHIVNTHHAYLEIMLPELSQLTTKIFRVHGTDSPELADVHKLFHDLKTELEQHTIDEEIYVFPLIASFETKPTKDVIEELSNKIDELKNEHEGAGAILAKLSEITHDYTVPDWGCTSYQLTFKKLEELESDLFEHIHLENNILFPRVIEKLKGVQK